MLQWRNRSRRRTSSGLKYPPESLMTRYSAALGYRLLLKGTPSQTCQGVDGRWILLGPLCQRWTLSLNWKKEGKKTEYKLLLFLLLSLPQPRRIETFSQKLQNKFSLKCPPFLSLLLIVILILQGLQQQMSQKQQQKHTDVVLVFSSQQTPLCFSKLYNFINVFCIFYRPPAWRPPFHCCPINQTHRCLLRRKRVILQWG